MMLVVRFVNKKVFPKFSTFLKLTEKTSNKEFAKIKFATQVRKV